jgi:lipoprotein-anchoring transpeptidase ErfK/SrfK
VIASDSVGFCTFVGLPPLTTTRLPRCALLLAALVALLLAAPSPAAARDPLVPGPTAKRAYTAKIVIRTAARSEPGGGMVVRRLATRARWSHGPNRLLVLESAYDRWYRLWLRVALPGRPNGLSGWVNSDHVQLRTTPWRITVNTTRRVASVYKRGRLMRRFAVVVGAPGTTTPEGLFAVSERQATGRPGGFTGSWVLALTARSSTLENYAGGPGVTALHGRGGASLRDPLGTARSHGCVRISNRHIAWLARVAGPGTPVRIFG